MTRADKDFCEYHAGELERIVDIYLDDDPNEPYADKLIQFAKEIADKTENAKNPPIGATIQIPDIWPLETHKKICGKKVTLLKYDDSYEDSDLPWFGKTDDGVEVFLASRFVNDLYYDLPILPELQILDYDNTIEISYW